MKKLTERKFLQWLIEQIENHEDVADIEFPDGESDRSIRSILVTFMNNQKFNVTIEKFDF